MTTDTKDRPSAAELMALVDAYAETAAVNGIRSQWAQMARGKVELALKQLPAPQAQADARDEKNEWQEISTMPTCDDLIWLYCQETNTTDGPIAPDPGLEQFGWTHWSYANAPSTEVIDRAAIAAQAARGE